MNQPAQGLNKSTVNVIKYLYLDIFFFRVIFELFNISIERKIFDIKYILYFYKIHIVFL